MRKTCVVIGLVVVFVLCAGVASADVFGLGPTLTGKGPGIVVEQRGASGPLPSKIIGLEGYSLWGKNAGAAAGICYKHRFLSVPAGQRTVRLRYGVLAGLAVAANDTRPLLGVFAEAEAEGLAGIVLVVRFDDGIYVNPGLMVNFLSVSF